MMNILLFLILFYFSGDSDNFISRLNKYLEESLKDYSRFEYEVVSQPETENSQIFIDETRDLKLNGGMGYVPVTLISNKGVKTQSLMSLKLKLFKKVNIASKDFKRGECLNAENIVSQITDVAHSRGDFFSDTSRTASYQSKLKIQKGDVIMMHMIEKIPVIKKGDQVTACVIKGNVRIDIDATARQDGCENEVISIMTIDKKNFKAKVIDRYSVIITE